MRLIDRYLMRQLLGPVALATLALTSVALLSQSLAGLDLIVNQRQSALVFLKVTLLYMPQLINLILPVAVFVAALVALNRLHTEQEIVVCFAGGMSRWRVISPAMRLACTIALLALLMNLFVQPAAFRELRQELFDVRTDLAATPLGANVDSSYGKVLSLLASSETQRAFDLTAEPEALRAEYGWHHFAQGLLLARRLVEAGVPYVTVYWNSPSNTDDQSWDTHADQHRRMREHLLPHFDRALSAVLDDLGSRGLLDETLVTWWGEFGRTPRINRQGGRDHWGFCQSIGLAGAGIVPGIVYGTSTKDGGYAETQPVRPDDLSATVLHLLGIDHKQHFHDLQNRPIPLSYGEPVRDLLA